MTKSLRFMGVVLTRYVKFCFTKGLDAVVKNHVCFILSLCGGGLTLIPVQASYLGYLYPSGVQKGKTVQVIAGGQFLNPNMTLESSNPGVKLKSAYMVPPMGNFKMPQKRWIMQWMKGIYAGDPACPPKPEMKEEKEWKNHPWLETLDKLPPLEFSLVAEMVFVKKNPLQAAPSLAQRLVLELEVEANAPVGPCTIRLISPRGVTNEKQFFIDDAPHTSEPLYTPPFIAPPALKSINQFPTIVDGQIMPGEEDKISLTLQKGQPYTFSMYASYFSPYLGDAVPGFFQGILTLLDDKGKEVAFADDEYHHADPVLRFTPEETGNYTLVVSDSLKRGRSDFVYRINLENKTCPYTPYKIFSDYQKMERQLALEKVTTPLTSEMIQQGMDIVGTLSTPKTRQKIQIKAQKGDHYIIETYARRLDSPLDTVLILKDQTGKVLCENDDLPTTLNIDLCRQNVDSLMDVRIPETGLYELELFDRVGNGGKDYSYVLQIRKPHPRALVYAQNSVMTVNEAGEGKMVFYAQRKDGFTGEIQILSPEWTVVGDALIPAGTEKAEIIFQMAKEETATEEQGKEQVNQLKNRRQKHRKNKQKNRSYNWHDMGNPQFIAHYKLGEQSQETNVIPADETMQAFAYTHLLVAEKFYTTAGKKEKNKKADKKKE